MSKLSAEKQVRTEVLRSRVAPELRRCGVYIVIGYLLLVGTVAGLEAFDLGGRWDRVITLGAVAAVPMLGGPLLIHRQLLRVDDRGVWRRRLLRWDLWSWEAFGSGQVHQGTGTASFVFPSKPWWHRTLELSYFQRDDREYVIGRIRKVWTPPPLPMVPAELTIRWGIRRWARLSREGLAVGKGKQDCGCLFSWAAVIRVRITRLEHGRRDFQAVEIILPEARPILLVVHKDRPLWTGADSQKLGAFLEQVVPSDRLLITAMTGPPLTVAEVDWRLLEANRMRRGNKQAAWFAGLSLLALVVLQLAILAHPILRPNPPPWDAGLILLTAVMCINVALLVTAYGAVLWTINNRVRSRCAELAARPETFTRGRP